jgi:protein-disulfide isomerase
MLFNRHLIGLTILIGTMVILSYSILQTNQLMGSVLSNTSLTTPSNASLYNLTALIETAAVLNETLANQVEQGQQLGQELRANATERIEAILNETLANQVEQNQQLGQELRANATE